MSSARSLPKIILLLVIAASVAGFFYFDLDQQVTLGGLQSGMDRFAAWRADHPQLFALSFALFYILVTALSLPGALVLTLAAGALFGLLWGTVIVSFASTFGATLAFLAARYLLQDSIQRRFGQRLRAVNEGIRQDGVFYLLTLRLVPIFPFFLINLLMGLSPMRAGTYFWVSQLGMLPGTLVYVNAGTQLAQVRSLADILSPALLLSFVLLGMFPLLAKKGVNMLKTRRIYTGFGKPKTFDRNLIVIGAGAGGLVTSYIAAAIKAKVTLIEAHRMGGDCLNFGCVPSKALIKSARVAHQLRNAEHFGMRTPAPEVDFKRVMQRVHQIIAEVEPHDSVERYEGLGVEVIQGHGRLIDPWTVEIEHPDGGVQRLSSRAIVLATGAQPYVPPLPGLNEVGYVTSDTLWEAFSNLDTAPKRLLVLGGGPIGCELAQSFARLGSEVIQIEQGKRLLPREDEDVSRCVAAALQRDGVSVLIEHQALRCEKHEGRKVLLVSHQGSEQRIEFDQLLCAVGRAPRLEGYGLEALNLVSDGRLQINEYLQTRFPNIFAVGDLIGPYQFTHTAAHQAWYATINALFGHLRRFRVDYRVIPWTTFVDPEVARVGLNEQEAHEQNIDYEVTRFELKELDRAITESATEGFIKVLTVPGKDRILGVTLVGAHSGDLMAEFVLAMKHGIGLNKILGTIHTYPTWAETNRYVAGAWKQAHTPQGVLRWVEKYHRWRRGDG